MRYVLILVILTILAFIFGPTVASFAGQTAGNLGLSSVAHHCQGDIGRGVVGATVLGLGLASIITLVRRNDY